MCFPSCRWKGRTVSEPPWTLWSWRDREASPSSQLLHTQCGRITTSTSLTHQVLNIVLDVESFVGNMLHMTPNDWPPLCGRFAGSALKKKKKRKENSVIIDSTACRLKSQVKFCCLQKLFLEPHTKTLNDWRWQGLGWKHQKNKQKKKTEKKSIKCLRTACLA